jgi:hypothetical protein
MGWRLGMMLWTLEVLLLQGFSCVHSQVLAIGLSQLFLDIAPFVLAPRLIISIWDTHAHDQCLHVSTAFADCVCLTLASASDSVAWPLSNIPLGALYLHNALCTHLVSRWSWPNSKGPSSELESPLLISLLLLVRSCIVICTFTFVCWSSSFCDGLQLEGISPPGLFLPWYDRGTRLRNKIARNRPALPVQLDNHLCRVRFRQGTTYERSFICIS